MKKRTRNLRKGIIFISFMISCSLQGDWTLDDLPERLELSEGERFKLNFNTSLESYSRVSLDRVPKYGNSTLRYGSSENSDFHISPKKCQSISNLTQVGKTSLAFFCTEELTGQESLIKFSSEAKSGERFRYVLLDNIKGKNYTCDRIIPLYDDTRLLISCYNEEKDILKLFDIRDHKSSKTFLANKYARKFKYFKEEFEYQKMTILCTKEEIASSLNDDYLYGIHFIQTNSSDSQTMTKTKEKENKISFYTFKILTTFYNKKFKLVNPFLLVSLKSFANSGDRFFNVEKIGKFLTDGRSIIVSGLIKSLKGYHQKIFLILDLTKEKEFKILGAVAPSLIIEDNHKLENHFRILNSQFTNFPPLVARFETVVDMENYLVIGIFQPTKGRVNLTVYKKNGIWIESRKMGNNRIDFLKKNVQTIEKFNLYEDRFLARYIDKEGKRRLSRWDFGINNDLDTYPMVEEGEVDSSVQDVLFLEDSNMNFKFPNPRKKLLYKTMIKINKIGDLKTRIFIPPVFEIDYEINNNNNFPPKLTANFHLRSYNEEDDRWKKREFDLNVTKYGGILELENRDGFRVDCYGKGNVVLHLPEILKGINSRISIDLFPKNNGISVVQLKGSELKFFGINFSTLENLRILNDKFFLTKYKGEKMLQILHCFPVTNLGYWSCFKLKEWKKEKKFKILSSGFDGLRNKVYMVIKIKRSNEFCFWSFGIKSFSMLFKEYCITDMVYKDGQFTSNNIGIFWFVAANPTIPSGLDYNLYVWNFKNFYSKGAFPMKMENPKRILKSDQKFKYGNILSVTSELMVFKTIFHVLILTPDVTLLKINTTNGTEVKEVLTYPVKKKSDVLAKIQNNNYLTILEKVSGEKNDSILSLTTKLKYDKKESNFLNVDQFQILSDLNEVYFGKIFKKIMNFKIQCDLGKKRNCVGFFIGKKTTDPDRKDDFALSVLNLNYEEEASNRLIGIYNLTGNFKIKKIIYNMDLEMYLIQLKNIDYENFTFFYVMENKTPFVRFGFSNIEQGRSEGQIMISTNYSNYLNNKNTYLENGLIHIHKVDNSFQYKIPKEKIDLKIFKEKIKYFLLDDILNLKGWVKEIKLEGEGKGGEVIQRLEKKSKGSLEMCIEEYFEKGEIISQIISVGRGEKASYIIYQALGNQLRLLVMTIKEGKCMNRIFYLYDGSMIIVKKYFLQGADYPSFIMAKRIKFSDKVNPITIEFFHVYFDQKNGIYSLEKKGISMYLRPKGLKFELNFADSSKNSFVMFVSNPDGETKDSLLAITFKIDPKNQTIMTPHIFDFKNSENNPNDHVIGKIDHIKSTAVGNNIFLLSRTKYKNKLLISYFKTTQGEKEVKLEHLRSQYYYLYFSKNDHRVLAELGLSLSQIAIKPNITNMKTELVLVSPLYQSFTFELQFNNFMRISKGDADILKNPLVAIHKLSNTYNGISDFIIRRIDFIKNYIQVRYVCQNLEIGFINKVIVYKLPQTDLEPKRKKKSNIVPILDRTYKTAFVFTSMEVSNGVPYLYLIGGERTKVVFKLLNFDFYKLNSKFTLMIDGNGEELENRRLVIYGHSGEKRKIKLEKFILLKKPGRIWMWVGLGVLILGFFILLIFLNVKQKKEEKFELSIESCSLNSDMNSSTVSSTLNLD